jgi:hypothetical protein
MDDGKTPLNSADYHRGAMGTRRDIGLRVVVGIVSLELLVVKFAIDAAPHVTDVHRLAWAIRFVTGGACVVLAGMLCQIEARNRRNRITYINAEMQDRPTQPGVPAEEPYDESFWFSVWQSWASTWPFLGVLGLTGAIWVVVGLLRGTP